MDDTKLTDMSEAVIGDFPGDLYGVFGGADKKVPTELFASWRTIHNATPTAVASITVDLTGYSIVRWSATGLRHDSGSTQSISVNGSTDGGATYSVALCSAAAAASTQDQSGAGILYRNGRIIAGIGNLRTAATANSGSLTALFVLPTSANIISTVVFKPSGGSFQAVGNITVEGLI